MEIEEGVRCFCCCCRDRCCLIGGRVWNLEIEFEDDFLIYVIFLGEIDFNIKSN